MDREKELEVVKTAYFLEDIIQTFEEDERQLREEKPLAPALPAHPVEPKLEQQIVPALPYPEIQPKTKFNWIIALVGMIFPPLGILWFAIYYFVLYKKAKEQEILAIQNSNEYKLQCADIDEQNRQRQAQMDKELHDDYLRQCEAYKEQCKEYEIATQRHKEDVKHYETVIVPAWSEELARLDSALNEARVALGEIYSQNIIPATYRNHAALQYLAIFIGTSQYDLKYAIERFDTYVMQAQQREQIDVAKAQMKLAEEQLEQQQNANWLREQSNNVLDNIFKLQATDIMAREYRRSKAQKERKKAEKEWKKAVK